MLHKDDGADVDTDHWFDLTSDDDWFTLESNRTYSVILIWIFSLIFIVTSYKQIDGIIWGLTLGYDLYGILWAMKDEENDEESIIPNNMLNNMMFRACGAIIGIFWLIHYCRMNIQAPPR